MAAKKRKKAMKYGFAKLAKEQNRKKVRGTYWAVLLSKSGRELKRFYNKRKAREFARDYEKEHGVRAIRALHQG